MACVFLLLVLYNEGKWKFTKTVHPWDYVLIAAGTGMESSKSAGAQHRYILPFEAVPGWPYLISSCNGVSQTNTDDDDGDGDNDYNGDNYDDGSDDDDDDEAENRVCLWRSIMGGMGLYRMCVWYHSLLFVTAAVYLWLTAFITMPGWLGGSDDSCKYLCSRMIYFTGVSVSKKLRIDHWKRSRQKQWHTAAGESVRRTRSCQKGASPFGPMRHAPRKGANDIVEEGQR